MSLLLLLGGQSASSAASATMPAVQVVIAGVGDVSDDFHLISTVRGRNRELDEFQAGTGMVTLLDRVRKYDPANTASPYYPNIRPMAGVQVLATWNGTTYPLLTGTVDSVESVYAGPLEGDAETTLYLTDGFKALQAADLGSGAHAVEVSADNPDHWYRLDEPSAAPTIFDSAGGRHLTGQGTREQDDSLIARDDNAALLIAGTASGGVSTATIHQAAVTALTVEVVYATADGGAGKTIAAEVNDVANLGWVIENDNGVLNATLVTSAGTVTMSTAGPLDDGNPRHIVLRWDGATGWLYLDGAQVDTDTLAGTMFSAGLPTYLLVSGATNGPIANTGAAGTFDELAIHYADIGAARITARYETVATPWNNDTPGERVARVLDAAGWPESSRDLDTGSVTLQPAELAQTALEHAQKAAASDFGALFITAGGDVRFIGREGLFNRPQLFTFGDGGGAELGYVSLRPELTDQLIANDVTVSRLDGTAQRVTDQDSITTYLRHSLVLDGLLFDDDTFALGAAQFLVSERKDPVRRVSNLVVAPRGAPSSLYPAVLGLELLDQITVIDRPPGGGVANTQDTSVEGISHTITPLGWETAWNLAPSLGAQGDPGVVWQLGTAGYSELGVTTRLAF